MALMKFLIPQIRRRKARLPAPGSAPGTLQIHEGLPGTTLSRTVFDAGEFEEMSIEAKDLGEAIQVPAGKRVWLDVQGLGDATTIKTIADHLGLHPLTLEDVVHVHQRPKVEEFDDHLFIVLRMVRLLPDGQVDNEQLSLVVKEDLLVTFQERPGDAFEPVRRRLREGKGHLRRGGAAYLAYALMDAVIDSYYPVLDTYTNLMDDLDDAVRADPTPDGSRAIHQVRRELRQLRRAVWPLRDVLAQIGRGDFDLFPEATRPAIRDCYDHTIQAIDTVDGARERASELSDLHMTMLGEKTNQVMKVLTIIATIFIPLTFLCGWYGMNFDPEASPYNMPELKWRYGYLVFMGVCFLVLVGMLSFFRYKGWLGKRR